MRRTPHRVFPKVAFCGKQVHVFSGLNSASLSTQNRWIADRLNRMDMGINGLVNCLSTDKPVELYEYNYCPEETPEEFLRAAIVCATAPPHDPLLPALAKKGIGWHSCDPHH